MTAGEVWNRGEKPRLWSQVDMVRSELGYSLLRMNQPLVVVIPGKSLDLSELLFLHL